MPLLGCQPTASRQEDPPWPHFSTFEAATASQVPSWIPTQEESPWGEPETDWSSNFSLVLLMQKSSLQQHPQIHNTTTLLLSKPDGLFRPWRWLLHADCTRQTKVYIKPSLGGHRGCYRACYMSHISLLLSIQLTYKLQKKQFPPLLLPFHYYYDNDGEMYIEQLKKEIPTVAAARQVLLLQLISLFSHCRCRPTQRWQRRCDWQRSGDRGRQWQQLEQ